MVSNLIWPQKYQAIHLCSPQLCLPFQIFSMYPELPPPFSSWLFSVNHLFSPSFKRKCQGFHTLPAPTYKLFSVLPLSPSPLMTPKTRPSSTLLYWCVYSAHSCSSLLASCSVNHSLSPILLPRVAIHNFRLCTQAILRTSWFLGIPLKSSG